MANNIALFAPHADIAVISDTAAGSARGRAAAQAAGGNPLEPDNIENAGEWLGSRLALDAALVILSAEGASAAEAVIDRIGEAAGQGRFRSVVAIPFDHIDAVHARLDHDGVEILCDASDVELAGALGLAMVRHAPLLRQPGDGDDPHLLRLSEEVARIARALAELSHGENGPAPGRSDLGEAPFAYRPEPSSQESLDADSIRRVIRMRRLRDRFFDAGLFADPAWDMLLDLMAARLERRHVAVSSLCIAAAVPPTTALRWIKSMTSAGLFERQADPRDGRRIFIALSELAASAIEAWFGAVRKEGGSAIL